MILVSLDSLDHIYISLNKEPGWKFTSLKQMLAGKLAPISLWHTALNYSNMPTRPIHYNFF